MLSRKGQLKSTLHQFMEERSIFILFNVIFVIVVFQKKARWRNTMHQFMRKRILRNRILVLQVFISRFSLTALYSCRIFEHNFKPTQCQERPRSLCFLLAFMCCASSNERTNHFYHHFHFTTMNYKCFSSNGCTKMTQRIFCVE